MSQFRHEWKHEITPADRAALRQRLRAVAQPDPHAPGGTYQIRSLYFDTPWDTALREKVNGVNRREKFRLRYYNFDPSLIHLEKKCKVNGLGTKAMAELSAQKAQAIVEVKWDAFLPDVIRDAVQLEGRRTSAFSKYAACRMYG